MGSGSALAEAALRHYGSTPRPRDNDWNAHNHREQDAAGQPSKSFLEYYTKVTTVVNQACGTCGPRAGRIYLDEGRRKGPRGWAGFEVPCREPCLGAGTGV